MLIAAPCDMPEQREPLEPQLVDDGLEVADHRLERHVRDVAVGEAGAPLVVADEPPIGGELGEEVAPDRARPVELEDG